MENSEKRWMPVWAVVILNLIFWIGSGVRYGRTDIDYWLSCALFILISAGVVSVGVLLRKAYDQRK